MKTQTKIDSLFQRIRTLVDGVIIFSCRGANDLPTDTGGSITITGTNFSPDYDAYKPTVAISSDDFGLSDCTTDRTSTSTQIVCSVGAGAGQFKVQVTVASQQSSWVDSEVKYKGPSVSTITPDMVFDAGGGDSITVSGTIDACRLFPDLMLEQALSNLRTHCTHHT